MKKFLWLTVCTVGLVGCGQTPPAEITLAPATAGFLASAPMDRIAEGTDNTTVRVYKMVTGEDGTPTRAEVTGAKCTLESDHLKATVVTPQEVILPNYDQNAEYEDRGVPPSILVTCTAGDLTGTQLLAAKPGAIYTGGSGNLLVDLIVIAGSAAVANTSDWRYQPSVDVVVE
ncbi:MAG: hypothetical protein AAF701_08370 [Pseudomonadota bacterium]